jgi:hypothetical protein
MNNGTIIGILWAIVIVLVGGFIGDKIMAAVWLTADNLLSPSIPIMILQILDNFSGILGVMAFIVAIIALVFMFWGQRS